MLAGIYVRVAQSSDRASLENQETRCRLAAAQAGDEIREEFVWREQCSGLDLEHPKLNEARQAASSGLILALYVDRPDRLSRDAVHLNVLLHEFLGYGIRLHFVEESSGAATEGHLLMYLKGYMGQR